MDYLKQTSLKSRFDWYVLRIKLPSTGLTYKFFPFDSRSEDPAASHTDIAEATLINGQQSNCLHHTIKVLQWGIPRGVDSAIADAKIGQLEEFYDELIGPGDPITGWSKENYILSEHIDDIVTFDGTDGYGAAEDKSVTFPTSPFPNFGAMYSPGGPCWDAELLDDDPEDPIVPDHGFDEYLRVEVPAKI